MIFFEDVTIRVGHRGRIRGECSTRGHRCTARRVRGAGRLSGSDSSRHDFEDDVVARFNNLFAHTGVELTGAIKILILCTIADIVLHTHVLASFQNGCMLYHTIERCGFEVVTIVLLECVAVGVGNYRTRWRTCRTRGCWRDDRLGREFSRSS